MPEQHVFGIWASPRSKSSTKISAARRPALWRGGFDRMVAEVSLGRTGAVAAREVSRFARNSLLRI